VHLVGFITKKFVTMHGHMIVKYYCVVWNVPNLMLSFVNCCSFSLSCISCNTL